MSDLFGQPPASPIKALTLHQPWASLMAWGVKTIETRGWATAYRGTLAIHAAKTLPAYAVHASIHNLEIGRAFERQGIDKTFDLPLGAVLAIVDLVDCRSTDDPDWVSDDQRRFGNFAPGALNPEHSRWLMGFPPAWGACAPTATPSTRGSGASS